MSSTPQANELEQIYRRRFADTAEYRNRVWQVLTNMYFNHWIRPQDVVLDLGCGYGEFINNICASRKLAMDLNPDARAHLHGDVRFLEQDCSMPWTVEEGELDKVFTSNFFEHLPSKEHLSSTLRQVYRSLREGGTLIAMGPNIKYLNGAYWDFYDHHTALSEASLAEALEIEGFKLELVIPRFLPFTLVNAPQYPVVLLKLYLLFPWLWWIKGRQFLIVASKPAHDAHAFKGQSIGDVTHPAHS